MKTLSNLNEGYNYGPKVGDSYNNAKNYVAEIYYDILDEIWNNKYYREKLQDKELNSKPFRFYKHLNDFLKAQHSPELPKSVYEIAKDVLDYNQDLCDLFIMDEDEYKKQHGQKYQELYGNNNKDKISTFMCADCGRRTPFQLKQDVIASSVFEDLLVKYGNGKFRPNEQATGRGGNNKVTTSCDLFYITDNNIKIPIEIKTKWSDYDKYKVKMRGESKTQVEKERGMVLAIYMNDNKAVLIDLGGNPIPSDSDVMAGGKNCRAIDVDPDKIFDFCFWKDEDLKKVSEMIETIYGSRTPKVD